MTKARIAAGAGAAILVVGAVVHLKPSPHLTAESFVSAAYVNTPSVGVTGDAGEISKLPICAVQTLSLEGAAAGLDGTTALDTGVLIGKNYDTDYGKTSAETFAVATKACVCGKFALTSGRICEASGNANPKGQAYLPRCPPKGTAIPAKYTAGCWCGADADFTSANTNLALGPDVTLSANALTAGNAATEDYQVCATKSVCLKGETCTAAVAPNPESCDIDGKKYYRLQQKYAWVLPKIKENALDAKFTICKPTVLQTMQCDATAGTSQAGNKPMCKEI